MKVTEIWQYPVMTMAGEIAVVDEVQLIRGRACIESAAAAVSAD